VEHGRGTFIDVNHLFKGWSTERMSKHISAVEFTRYESNLDILLFMLGINISKLDVEMLRLG